MSALTTSIQHCTGVIARTITQENVIKDIYTEKKEIILFLFDDDITLYTKNLKKSTNNNY